MAVLHVRNVPDELYRRLNERAARERRSISGEVVSLLERALDPGISDTKSIIARMRVIRESLPASMPQTDSVALLREDRER